MAPNSEPPSKGLVLCEMPQPNIRPPPGPSLPHTLHLSIEETSGKTRPERPLPGIRVFVFFLFGLQSVPLGLMAQGDEVGGQGPGPRPLLLDDLNDIFMLHGVGQAHALRAVLGAGAPHQRVLELAGQRPVDAVAHMLHGGPFP